MTTEEALQNANAILQRRLQDALERGLTDYRNGFRDGRVIILNDLVKFINEQDVDK